MKAKTNNKPNNDIPTINIPIISIKCPKYNDLPSESKKTKPTPIKSKCSS